MNKAMILLAHLYGFAGNTGDPEVPSDDTPDWSTLFDDEIEPQDSPTDENPAPVETPPAEETPAPAPQPAPEVEPPKEEVVPPAEDAPKPEAEAPKPPVEQPKELTQAERDAQIAQFQGELEGMYAITEQEADALLADPVKTLPKFAAQIHLKVMQQVAMAMQAYQQTLPQVVEQTTEVVKQKREAADEFNTRWPGLTATVEGQQASIQAIQIAKQQNPTASRKDIIEKSGRIAYSILGKDVPAVVPPAPAAKQKPTPHLPAATKSAGNVQPQQLTQEQEFYATLGDY